AAGSTRPSRPAALARVADRAVGDGDAGLVGPGPGHAGGTEDVLALGIVELLARDLFDDETQDHRSRVGVGVALAGRKEERGPREKLDVVREPAQARRRRGEILLSEDVPHARTVGDELLERDLVRGRDRQVREVLRESVAQRELAARGEL